MKFTPVTRSCGLLLAAVLSVPVSAQDAAYTTLQEKAGYGVGFNIGTNLMQQGLDQDIDAQALIDGINDALAGQMRMSEEDIMAAIQEFAMQQQAKVQAEQQALVAQQEQFLTDNAGKPGITTTASGLQYEVISEGSGGNMPAESDTVSVHYHGTLIDGTVFDSSVERGEPVSFPLNGVIAGWTEGLQLMQVGDKYRFYIPSALAYGDQAAGPIAPGSTLIFDVELLGIE